MFHRQPGLVAKRCMNNRMKSTECRQPTHWRGTKTAHWMAGFWFMIACVLLSAADSKGATGKPEEPDFMAMSLEDLGAIKVPIVYGASKHEQKITEAPSSVSIVTRDEIQKFGYRTIADVIRSVRGFYVSYDRTYGYVGVRGFNRPGDFGGRTLMLVDGHRINEPLFDSSMADTGFPLDIDLIERVEVVRGPGSTLYGNNAFFAVINVVTRRGQSVNGAEMAFSAGSFDSYQARFSYGKQFTNDLELLISGSWYDSHGPGRLYVPEFDRPDQNNGIAENVDRDGFHSGFTKVRYHGLTFEGSYVSRQKDSPFAPYDSMFNDPRQHPIDTRGYASLGWDGTTEGDWLISTRASYDYYALAADYPYNAATPGDPAYVVINREKDSAQWVGLEGQLSKLFFDRHRLTFGAEGRYDFSLNIQSYDVEPYDSLANLHENATRTGVFTQAEVAVLTNLTLNAGARYDYFSSFGGTFSPRAALIYNPWKKSTFKFLYGEAYRAPNVWEVDFHNSVSKANSGLKPENIRSYELVYDQYLSKDFKFSLSGFVNQTRNLIAQTTDPADNLLFYRNVDEAQTRGGEVEVEHRSEHGVLARASYSLQRTENTTTGEELSNSPRHLLKGNLTVPLWSQKLFASAELQYSSRALTRPGSNPGSAASFWVANLTLFSREIVKNLEISASLYNIFDKKYSYPLGDEYIPAIIQQDGRTFRVKLCYKF